MIALASEKAPKPLGVGYIRLCSSLILVGLPALDSAGSCRIKTRTVTGPDYSERERECVVNMLWYTNNRRTVVATIGKGWLGASWIALLTGYDP